MTPTDDLTARLAAAERERDGAIRDADNAIEIARKIDAEERETLRRERDEARAECEAVRAEYRKACIDAERAQTRAESLDDECERLRHDIERAQERDTAMVNECERLRSAHCKDCCCARSWDALGITDYTGRSIPEHIEALREECERLRDELNARQHEVDAYRAARERDASESVPARHRAGCAEPEDEMTDTIARTIAALRERYGNWPVEVYPWSGAIYLRIADLLAICDAAEAGLRSPPREPTEAMVNAGLSAIYESAGGYVARTKNAWRAMWDAAPTINEGGQDAATREDADGAGQPGLIPCPVPPSPDAPAPDAGELERLLRVPLMRDGLDLPVANKDRATAADAIERLTRERDEAHGVAQACEIRAEKAERERDEARAERDALREVVRAADAVRTLQFDDLWEVREYDRARAAWKDEV